MFVSRADDVPSEVTIPRLHPPVLRFSAPSPTFSGKQLAVAQVASTITPHLFVSLSLSGSFSRRRIYSALLVLYGQAFLPGWCNCRAFYITKVYCWYFYLPHVVVFFGLATFISCTRSGSILISKEHQHPPCRPE